VISLKNTNTQFMSQQTNQIKLVILDIDGVLTDGTKVYDLTGKVVGKRFNDKDFTAIKRLKAAGVKVCFLTGDLNVNEEIAKKRGIDLFFSRTTDGSLSKKSFLPTLYEMYGASKENTVYVGDDLFDLDIIQELTWTYCPKDAIIDLRMKCHDVLGRNGGDGVVAELYMELVMEKMIVPASLETIVEIDRIESMTALKK